MTSPESRKAWVELLFDELDSKVYKRKPRLSVGVNLPESLQAVVLTAAKRRGMSMAAFMRRAALTIAIHDLELDYHEVMADEPAIHAFVREQSVAEAESGVGHGPWKIEGLGYHDVD